MARNAEHVEIVARVSSPWTITQARAFAEQFHGIRPTPGDPIDFSRVPVGFFPMGILPPKQEAERLMVPPEDFWNRIAVPAFPLMIAEHTPATAIERTHRRYAGAKIIGDHMESFQYFREVHLIMHFDDAVGGWSYEPVMTMDLFQEIPTIEADIQHLADTPHPTQHQLHQLAAKRFVKYLYTGQA